MDGEPPAGVVGRGVSAPPDSLAVGAGLLAPSVGAPALPSQARSGPVAPSARHGRDAGYSGGTAPALDRIPY